MFDRLEDIVKHYEEISALEPNNCEALFYLTVLKSRGYQSLYLLQYQIFQEVATKI